MASRVNGSKKLQVSDIQLQISKRNDYRCSEVLFAPKFPQNGRLLAQKQPEICQSCAKVALHGKNCAVARKLRSATSQFSGGTKYGRRNMRSECPPHHPSQFSIFERWWRPQTLWGLGKLSLLSPSQRAYCWPVWIVNLNKECLHPYTMILYYDHKVSSKCDNGYDRPCEHIQKDNTILKVHWKIFPGFTKFQ